MSTDPAVIASIIVGIIAAGSAYASQRAASRAANINTREISRVDMEKEAYERARKFDTETINRQDIEAEELRKENEELQVKIRALIQHIIQLEQAKGYYPGYPPKKIEGEKNEQEPIYNIKSAYSTDGINWIPQLGVVLGLEEDEGGIAAARLISNNKLYYSVRNKFDYRTNSGNTYRIKRAEYIDDKFIKIEGKEMELDDDELMNAYPFIIIEQQREILFFNSDFGSKGLSYAIKEK